MKERLLLLAILVLAFLTRVINLAADPSILLDSGQVGDEGFWIYNARNLVLFGQTAIDDFYHDLAAAPVFSFFSLASFSLLDVGFWQARLVSAISGFVTVIFAYLLAREFSPKVALLSTVFVAFNVLLLLHNRLAVGESLSVAFLSASVYFLAKRQILPAGLLAGLCIMSKTTSFIYIPSLLLIMIWGLTEKKFKHKDTVNFLFSTGLVILAIFVPIFIFKGQEILLIYKTFGVWYRPQSLYELWQNVFNFFIHPFWGSPFIFILVMAAVVNVINFLWLGERKNTARKVLIFWILGVLALGPLISRITNARLLALIVPISILAAQTLVSAGKAKIDLVKIAQKIHGKKILPVLLTIVFSFPVSIIASKITLAIAKRVSGNFEVVNYLPQLSLILFPVLVLFFLANRNYFFEKLIRFFLVSLIFLPVISFVFVISGYLSFFNILEIDSTTVLSFIVLLILGLCLLLSRARMVNFYPFANILILVNFVFLLFGLSTILVSPSYKIKEASLELGEIAGSGRILGFYGHELSAENRTAPIYFAPRLTYVGEVNRDFEKYKPEFLLETRVFDSRVPASDPWPRREDLAKDTIFLETFDLSRRFLGATRIFEVDLFQIRF